MKFVVIKNDEIIYAQNIEIYQKLNSYEYKMVKNGLPVIQDCYIFQKAGLVMHAIEYPGTQKIKIPFPYDKEIFHDVLDTDENQDYNNRNFQENIYLYRQTQWDYISILITPSETIKIPNLFAEIPETYIPTIDQTQMLYGVPINKSEYDALIDLERHCGIIIPVLPRMMTNFFGFWTHNGHIIGLNLAKANISSLPDSIANFTELQWLNLNKNPISNLPKSITNLHALKRIYIADRLEKIA